MADVYRARDTELPRDVAIKILKPSNEQDPDVRASFLDEVQLASRCSHENIVMTYDKGEFEGHPFIVMEFLRGENLDKLIRNHQVGNLKRILRMSLQLARALEYVHSLKIVHRDLKPQNIHVDQNGHLKLVDFGIAKAVDWNKTQVGLVKGTAFYMAPEQVLGEPVAFRTDIWAFGVVMYELLTDGRRPFQGTTLDTLWAAIINGTPDFQILRDRSVPAQVQQLVERCLEKKPECRFAGFGEVASTIETILDELSMGVQTAIVPPPTPPTVHVLPFKILPFEVPPFKIDSRSTWLIIGAIGVVIIAILSLLIHNAGSDKKPDAPKQLAKHLPMSSGDMVLVDAGPALLGSDKHRVNLPAFYIDKTEVSNGVYARFVQEKHRRAPKGFAKDKPEYPVVNVSLYDAMEFAKWAGKRLPTSDEWEKAARGTKGQLYPWGDKPKPELANLADNALLPKHGLKPVTAFPGGASPYGALNMCGNVWEWVDADQKPTPEYLEKMRLGLDRTLTLEDAFYGIRGGYFNLPLSPELVSEAASFPAKLGADNIGFRCAMDPR
jgi:serine/threonine-protein kinase